MEEMMVLQQRQQQARKHFHRALVKNGVAIVLVVVIMLTVIHVLFQVTGSNTHASTQHSLISADAHASCSLGDAVSALVGADVTCALLPPYNVAGAL